MIVGRPNGGQQPEILPGESEANDDGESSAESETGEIVEVPAVVRPRSLLCDSLGGACAIAQAA